MLLKMSNMIVRGPLWQWTIIGAVPSTVRYHFTVIVVFVHGNFIDFLMVLSGNIRGARLQKGPAMAAASLMFGDKVTNRRCELGCDRQILRETSHGKLHFLKNALRSWRIMHVHFFLSNCKYPKGWSCKPANFSKIYKTYV